MADGVVFAIFVEVRRKLGVFNVEIVAKERTQVGAAVLGLGQQLYAIAGAQDQPLVNARMLGETLQGIGQSRFRDRQTLPHFDRRAVVIDADELKVHDCANL